MCVAIHAHIRFRDSAAARTAEADRGRASGSAESNVRIVLAIVFSVGDEFGARGELPRGPFAAIFERGASRRFWFEGAAAAWRARAHAKTAECAARPRLDTLRRDDDVGEVAAGALFAAIAATRYLKHATICRNGRSKSGP